MALNYSPVSVGFVVITKIDQLKSSYKYFIK